MSRALLVLFILVPVSLLAGCDRNEAPPVAANIPIPAASVVETPQNQNPGETETLSPRKVQSTLTLMGKISYGEDRYTKLSSPLQGRVLEVRAMLGDQVQVGNVLLVIDSPDLTAAYSDFVKEISELQFATRAYSLAKDLYETKALPFKDLKQAEYALIKEQAEFQKAKERLLALKVPMAELEKPLSQQKVTARFEVKSPMNGTVVERTVTPGQWVGNDPSQALVMVADLDRLQMVADVYERDLARIRVGQPAIVTVEAYPGIEFPSIIGTIGDLVDRDTRTVKILAWVQNNKHRLKPEMFARLKVVTM